MIKDKIEISTNHPILNEKNFFLFRHNGLLCAISRMSHNGVLNGYVAVPNNHPSHGSGYDDLSRIDVHGGLTYSNGHLGNIHEDVFPDLWWFGFDTNHLYDKAPFQYFSFESDGTYKDFDYVMKEVKSLAEQLNKLS